MMPGIDGFTCCQKICSLAGDERVAIVMITALDDPESIQQALDAGANDHISKPIQWAVLSEKVERLLSKSGRVAIRPDERRFSANQTIKQTRSPTSSV